MNELNHNNYDKSVLVNRNKIKQLATNHNNFSGRLKFVRAFGNKPQQFQGESTVKPSVAK